MNQKEVLDLKKLVDNNTDYVDNTEGIRRLRHSELIRNEIIRLQNIKKEYSHDNDNSFILSKCQQSCSFLYTSYTDIFNRVFKDELDIELMFQALEYLKKIEDGHIDQQEGSVMMGKLLHKVFVTSALKKSENLDKEFPPENRNKGDTISWKEYKQKYNANI
jgi:hypothetical protein